MTLVRFYNNGIKNILNGSIDLDTSTIKVILVSNYIFNPADTDYSDISSHELATAHGYTNGGHALTTPVITFLDGVTTFSTDNLTISASGGSIGPFDGVIYYCSTTNKLMFYVDPGGTFTALTGTDILFTMGADGVVSFVNPA